MKGKKNRVNLLALVVLMLSAMFVYKYYTDSGVVSKQITYTEFSENYEDFDTVTVKVNISQYNKNYDITGEYKEGSDEDATRFYLTTPYSETTDVLLDEMVEAGVDVEFGKVSQILLILSGILPMLLLFGVLIYFFMRQANGGGAMEVGKSKAKLHTSKKKVTYDAVAGLEEEKQELIEVVDFLKTPKKFEEMGARIPKGVLLVGPPGTGKTLLAKSVAGEAGVPFYFISGSDFLEMFVGVGASRF